MGWAGSLPLVLYRLLRVPATGSWGSNYGISSTGGHDQAEANLLQFSTGSPVGWRSAAGNGSIRKLPVKVSNRSWGLRDHTYQGGSRIRQFVC